MINFPSQFNEANENTRSISSGLLQPSVKAVDTIRPLRLVPITGTAQASELSASSAPKLATPELESKPKMTLEAIQKKIYYPSIKGRGNSADALDFVEEGYKYNSQNEGMKSEVYLDTAAKIPSDWNDQKKYKGQYQKIGNKIGVLTAGTGYIRDENGNFWKPSQLGKVVTNREKDRARYEKDHLEMDSDFVERFPALWAKGSVKQKAALVSFLHNVGVGYAKEGNTSDLHKQMKRGNWAAIAENVRTWSHDKEGNAKNPLLESRRKRDYLMLTQNKKK